MRSQPAKTSGCSNKKNRNKSTKSTEYGISRSGKLSFYKGNFKNAQTKKKHQFTF